MTEVADLLAPAYSHHFSPPLDDSDFWLIPTSSFLLNPLYLLALFFSQVLAYRKISFSEMPLSLLQMKQERLNRKCNIGTFTVLRMENPKEAIVRLIPSQKARVQTRLCLELYDDHEFIVEPDEHTELIWAAILSQNNNMFYISTDGIDWKRMILKIRLGCEVGSIGTGKKKGLSDEQASPTFRAGDRTL